MFPKTSLLALTILGIILAAGLGYAAFTSSVNAKVTAKAGRLDLQIVSLQITAGPSYVKLITVESLPASNVHFSLSPIAPGDQIIITSVTKNVGSLPAASIGDAFLTHSSLTCPTSAALLDALPTSLASGAMFTTRIQVSATNFVSACQGATVLTFLLEFEADIGD